MEMEGVSREEFGRQTLQRIAEQLQFHREYNNLKLYEEEGDDNKQQQQRQLQVKVCCGKWKERRAAVLVCVFEGHSGELRVILTRRSVNLSSYPGDVALPGGKMEAGDEDESATALREAMEEIGLQPHLVQVVTNLQPFTSQNQLSVVPVIGLLPRVEDFRPLLNRDEVDAIFDAPLEMFLKEEKHRCEERAWKGYKYALHIFELESEQGLFLICGLTASILIGAASLIYQRLPPFAQHLHLPDFQQLAASCPPHI